MLLGATFFGLMPESIALAQEHRSSIGAATMLSWRPSSHVHVFMRLAAEWIPLTTLERSLRLARF